MPRRTEAAPRRSSRTPIVIGVLLVALVAVAAFVAVALSNPSPSGVAEPARQAVGVAGQALPPLQDSASDPALGQPIPRLTGTSLEGETMTIGPDDGPLAIVLLAHWCSHCQAEVPVLVDYLAGPGMPDGVDIVAVSTSIDPARPNYPPSAWLEREGWTVPTMVDDGASRALGALGMSSFPGFVFVDDAGRVAGRVTGELDATTFDRIVTDLGE